MARITCPYCGTKQTLSSNKTTCANASCSSEIPSNYIENVRKRPETWMVTIGYKQHGKTTYLDSLALVMENLGKISRGTFSTYLDANTFEKLRAIRVEAQQGNLAESTSFDVRPKPLLISLPNFLGHKSNTLVINDLPGEIFDRPELADGYAEAIRQAETIWFVISLADILEDKEGHSIAELVQIYVDNMKRVGAKTRGRRVLVAYTKADRIAYQLTQSIRDYLGSDPYSRISQMMMSDANVKPFEFDYINKMHAISNELQEFTFNKVPRGADFIAMIEHYEMELSFCVVASVPGADGKTTGVDTPRFRVIDPLIWSLTSIEPESPELQCGLILDAGANYEAMFAEDIPGAFYDALQNNNLDIQTFFAGQQKIATDQRPEKPPKKPLIRFIGPILDRLPENACALLILNNTPLDLYDYVYTKWHERLFLVCLRDLQIEWPHKIVYNSSETDPYDIVNEFIETLSEND